MTRVKKCVQSNGIETRFKRGNQDGGVGRAVETSYTHAKEATTENTTNPENNMKTAEHRQSTPNEEEKTAQRRIKWQNNYPSGLNSLPIPSHKQAGQNGTGRE